MVVIVCCVSACLLEIDDAALRSICEPVGPVYSVKIPPGKGCAFVQFVYPQHAEHVINSLNGYTVRPHVNTPHAATQMGVTFLCAINGTSGACKPCL